MIFVKKIDNDISHHNGKINLIKSQRDREKIDFDQNWPKYLENYVLNRK